MYIYICYYFGWEICWHNYFTMLQLNYNDVRMFCLQLEMKKHHIKTWKISREYIYICTKYWEPGSRILMTYSWMTYFCVSENMKNMSSQETFIWYRFKQDILLEGILKIFLQIIFFLKHVAVITYSIYLERFQDTIALKLTIVSKFIGYHHLNLPG